MWLKKIVEIFTWVSIFILDLPALSCYFFQKLTDQSVMFDKINYKTRYCLSKKDTILKAAVFLFAEKGFKDTSIAELAKATGASTANVFYHFNSKEALFLATLEHVKNGIVHEFEDYIAKREFESGLLMMEGIVSFYLYLAGSMEAWFLLLHNHYPYRLAMVNDVCRSHLEKTYNSLIDIFEDAVIIGKSDGSIKDIDSRKTALIIFSMVDGLVRFKIYNLYDTAALYNELIRSCRKILKYKD